MASQPPGGPSAGSKAIASLAKKQSDVTRQGTQKLKFTPLKRKKTDVPEVKPEPTPNVVPSPAESSRGRGRGRGGDRGRGRGRGAAPVEMTASGPFAMGPAMAGSAGVRRTQAQTPIAVPTSASRASALGSGLSRTTAPSLKREPEDQKLKNEADDEVYSEPDEGVEIIDLDNVHKMDWMAPESLQRLKTTTKKKKRLQEEKDGKGKGKAQQDDVQPDSQENNAEVDLANALDLSESEEEEEMEDLIDDFARANTTDETSDFGQDRLLWFQFPSPFPTFTSKSMEETTTVVPDSDPPFTSSSQSPPKKVAFAPDTKPPAPSSTTPAPPEEQKEAVDPKVDGIIGQLEVYQSGVVKIRLNNGILLDVTSATQPSFLQHAVSLDVENKRMCVLGEVNKRFIASPNVDMLLHALETAEAPPSANGEQDLVSMDVG